MLGHLDALLADPLPAITLDGALVRPPGSRSAASRWPSGSTAGSVPTPRRRRCRTGRRPPSSGPPALRSSPASGKPLTEGIPGFYTPDGFHKVLLGNLAQSTRSVADESWVLGRTEEIPSEGPRPTLEHAVVALYVADFEKQWDDLLDDLALAPFGDHDATVQRLYVLSSPQSPMRDLLVAIAHELTLMPAPAPAGDPVRRRLRLMACSGGRGGAAEIARRGDRQRPTPDAASAMPAIAGLEQHYRPPRDFVGDGQAAPLSGVLQLINGLQNDLAQSARMAANVPASVQGSGNSLQLLRAEAQRQPKPVSRWLQQIVDSGSRI